MPVDTSTVLVVIPAFNEQSSVAQVVSGVRRVLPGAGVVVVDDASADRTAEVAERAGAVVLRLPFNLGVGGAMRTGFLYARRQGYRTVVQVDADGQHDPSHLPSLLAALEDADVAIGARFAGSGDYTVRGPRRWAMRLLSVVLSRLAGVRLTDTTSGFRATGERALALFAEHYPAEYLGDTVESLVLALRAGLRVTQVPVQMGPRQGGVPSQSVLRASLYLFRAVLALCLASGRAPVRLPPAVVEGAA
ncbi:MAG: glycosyl transferase [Frankiales bacterium]|nr:glycosyl transferase [Frankiales bacterium]